MEVHLIDKMGSDLSVVNSARVSFSKESEWELHEEVVDDNWIGTGATFTEVTQHLKETDQKLIKYLARNNHWTPFSHVQITLREKVPIFVARQRFKHMVGFTYNEISRRYVSSEPEFYIPSEWRGAAENKKQGSSDEVIEYLSYPDYDSFFPDREIKVSIKESYKYFIQEAENLYNKMIEDGVAPEQARMVLPQSMYTTYYVTGSLAAWARAYKLRSDSHAQKEIQDLTKMWNDIIGTMEDLKHSWQALT